MSRLALNCFSARWIRSIRKIRSVRLTFSVSSAFSVVNRLGLSRYYLAVRQDLPIVIRDLLHWLRVWGTKGRLRGSPLLAGAGQGELHRSFPRFGRPYGTWNGERPNPTAKAVGYYPSAPTGRNDEVIAAKCRHLQALIGGKGTNDVIPGTRGKLLTGLRNRWQLRFNC